MSNLKITNRLEFPTCDQRQQSCSCKSAILKICFVVFGLLLIGGAITAHIYQVNPIAVYTLGGAGGCIMLTTAILSIAQYIYQRRSERSEIKEQPQPSIHEESQEKPRHKDIPSSIIQYQQSPVGSDMHGGKEQALVPNLVANGFYKIMPSVPNASPDKCETNQIQDQAPDGSTLRQYEEKQQWLTQDEYHERTKTAQEVYDTSMGETRQTVSQVRGFCNTQVAMLDQETLVTQKWDGSRGVRGHGVSYHYHGEVRAVNPSFLRDLKEAITDGWKSITWSIGNNHENS